MRLSEICIRGFKSFANDAEPIFLGNLNVLIGPNGSGKSNLIDAFELLSAIANSRLQYFNARNGYPDAYFHFGKRATSSISLSATLEKDDFTFTYDVSLVSGIGDFIFIANETLKEIDTKQEGPVKVNPIIVGEIGEKESTVFSKEYTKPHWRHADKAVGFLKQMAKIQKSHFAETDLIGKKIYYMDANEIHTNGEKLAAFLNRLNHSETERPYYQRIERQLQSLIPGFHAFDIQHDVERQDLVQLNWRHVDNPDYLMGPHHLSDGSRRLIALSTLLLQPEWLLPSIILIDEPELGLHPTAIDALGGMLKMASMHTQIVVATHSTGLLDAVEPEDVIVFETKNGCTQSKRLSSEELNHWLKDYDQSLSVLWQKNVIGGLP